MFALHLKQTQLRTLIISLNPYVKRSMTWCKIKHMNHLNLSSDNLPKSIPYHPRRYNNYYYQKDLFTEQHNIEHLLEILLCALLMRTSWDAVLENPIGHLSSWTKNSSAWVIRSLCFCYWAVKDLSGVDPFVSGFF